MKLKILSFAFILLFSIENVFSSTQDSTRIHQSRYFKASTMSSYGPLALAGVLNMLLEDEDKDKDSFSHNDTVPDLESLFLLYHLGFGGYYSVSSIIGLTYIGKQKLRIFTKCLLYDAGILALTMPFYSVPQLAFIPIVAVAVMPIINSNIAYNIDKNQFQSKPGKITFCPYFGFQKSVTAGVLISF
ncbi:hypothetical protein GF337_16520 [candidate division KSB1 bacterium]|nr:hypothetical protein [candidate division KSB1 bacterium]